MYLQYVMRTFANIILGYRWKKWVYFDFIDVMYLDIMLIDDMIKYLHLNVHLYGLIIDVFIDFEFLTLYNKPPFLELAFTSWLARKNCCTDVRRLNFDCWKMSRILHFRCVLQQFSCFLRCVKMLSVQVVSSFLCNYKFLLKVCVNFHFPFFSRGQKFQETFKSS